jgi:hypothetical protein
MTDPGEYQPDAQVFIGSRMKWLDRLQPLPAHQGFQQAPEDSADMP